MTIQIVCESVSHGNTRKIADEMATVLGATVVDSAHAETAELERCDLVGFGSGIYAMAFHPRLLRLVLRLPRVDGTKAFVFATRGGPDLGYTGWLARLLRAKGFDVVGRFSCRGYDTWLPLRLVGGLNRSHPDARDLEAVRAFARGLLEEVEQADVEHAVAG